MGISTATQSGESTVELSRLPAGSLVATERVPGVRSVAIGVWVQTGSRDERPAMLGISHFLEHMMFKGTRRRDAREIARSLESLGSSFDAYTTREYTCYQTRVVDEHLPRAMDVIGDCLSNSLFAPEHIEREKLVVTEEIQSYEDSPDEHIQDLVSECVWRGHPLGTPILGTRETVSGFNAANVREHFATAYHSGRTMISAAGNLDHAQVVELAQTYLHLPASPAAGPTAPVPLTYTAIDRGIERDLAQLNLCLGTPGLAYGDPRRPALMVLNGILGGSMSSRIFQRVREDEGLAYSVFTDVDCHHDSGIFVCGMAVSPSKGKRAVRLVGEEFRRLTRDGLAPGELEDMKSQFRGNILLGLESTGTRMGRLAKSLIYYGRPVAVEELLARVEAVTEDEVLALAADLLRPERFSIIALGPLPEGELRAAELL